MPNTNVPPVGPVKKSKPLQLKRGTSRAFYKWNGVLLEGQPAFEINTQRLKIGDGHTKYNDLKYIGEGDGKSAYEIWLDQGHSGTVEDFLDSLIGPPGKSTYELWLSLGNEGTIADFIDSLIGPVGPKGKSAYEVWRDDYMHDPSLTIEDYVIYNRTYSWADIDEA